MTDKRKSSLDIGQFERMANDINEIAGELPSKMSESQRNHHELISNVSRSQAPYIDGYLWVLRCRGSDGPDAMSYVSRLSIRRPETSEAGGDLFEATRRAQAGYTINVKVIDLNGMAQQVVEGLTTSLFATRC